MQEFQVLVLPGWQSSGVDHWQTHWEKLYGYQRVEQYDWLQPLKGDWMMRLEEAVLQAQKPVVLVAHSLGCWLTAVWSSHSQNTDKVKKAFLVAPPSSALFHVEPKLHSWRNVPQQKLRFSSLLLTSSNDPYCTEEQALMLAQQWGSVPHKVGALGHVNAESGLGTWEQGYVWLQEFLNKE